MENSADKKRPPKKTNTVKKDRSKRRRRREARKQVKKLRKEFEKDMAKRRKESRDRTQTERAEKNKKTKSVKRTRSKVGLKKMSSKTGVKKSRSKSSENMKRSSSMSLSAFTIGNGSSVSLNPIVNKENAELSALHSDAQKQQRKDIENNLQTENSAPRSPSQWHEKEERGEHVQKQDIQQTDNKLQQVQIDTIINSPTQKQTSILSPSNWADSKLEEDSETKNKITKLPDNID